MKFVLKDQQFSETWLCWICSQNVKKELTLKPLGKVKVESELPLIERRLEILTESPSLLHDSQNNVVSRVSYEQKITGLCVLIGFLIDIVYWFVSQPHDKHSYFSVKKSTER